MSTLRQLTATCAAALVVALVVAACAPAGLPTTDPPATERTPTPPTAATAQPAPVPPATPTAGDDDGDIADGAQVRLVNIWAEPAGLGPSIALRLVDEGRTEQLVEAAPSTVTPYAAIPAIGFDDEERWLEVARVDAGDAAPFELRDIRPGERVTVFAHGWPDEAGNVGMYAFAMRPWAWPELEPGKVALLTYMGALHVLADRRTIFLTADGECLVDRWGEAQTAGWGGNAPKILVLDAGTTVLDASHRPGPAECTHADPLLGQVTIDGQPGDRWALVPWGPSEAVELLLVEMDDPPTE